MRSYLLKKKVAYFHLINQPNFWHIRFFSLSETSFVNLGFASSLIGHALGLTIPKITIAPATCQASFAFKHNKKTPPIFGDAFKS
jgi:hypothetical protein